MRVPEAWLDTVAKLLGFNRRYRPLNAAMPLFEKAKQEKARHQMLRDMALPGVYMLVGSNTKALGLEWAVGVHARFERARLRCKQDVFDFIEREQQLIRDNWPETWPGERICWSG